MDSSSPYIQGRQNTANSDGSWRKIFLKLLKLDDESLDKGRLKIFHVAVNKGSVGSECKKLPPTSAAAAQHSRRVYWQVQTWMENDLDCNEWGWFCSTQGEYKAVISTLPYVDLLAHAASIIVLTTMKTQASNQWMITDFFHNIK